MYTLYSYDVRVPGTEIQVVAARSQYVLLRSSLLGSNSSVLGVWVQAIIPRLAHFSRFACAAQVYCAQVLVQVVEHTTPTEGHQRSD